MECTAQITELMAEGIERHLARDFGAAVARYARVVEILPEHGEAWRLLGIVALQSGDNPAARSLLERAIRIDAGDAAAQSALGSVNEFAGQLDSAYIAYAAAYAIDATQAPALLGLMRVALALGRAQEAIAFGEAGLARGTSDAGLLRALGAARLTLRDYAGAAEAFLTSLQMEPHADAYANLGAAYTHLHQIDAAIVACQDALALNPGHAEAANNLGVAYKTGALFPAAMAAFERAVELGSEGAHVNLGATHLLLGNYRSGWPHYGWVTAERRANPAYASLPMWDGTPDPARRLLIWPELGIGDSIQMLRFLRNARELVGSVTLACLPGTRDLWSTLEGVDALIDTREIPPFDSFDFWLPTSRLPVVFGIEREAIPVAPYLHADPERTERFRPRLDAPGRLRVGLVWSGNPRFPWNDLRSCGLAELEALHAVPGVTWFALQQGAARTQQTRNGMDIIPINAAVTDFADTAAIIDRLDLLITVDTSVANLAGALGKPAWVVLSNRPDWRWQLTGEVSPWYPTLRLFRQRDDGAWAPVIAAVAAALRELVEHRSMRPWS